MLKKIKHGTTAMVESLKHGKGPAFINPEFEVAVTHFTDYQTHVKLFLDDAQAIVSAVTPVFKHFGDFSALTEKTWETFPREELGGKLGQLSRDIGLFVSDTISPRTNDSVINALKEIQKQLADLTALKDEQHQNFLILESNKSKLEGLQKEPEKNAREIESYTDKNKARTTELERLEADFIQKVAVIWEQRFTILGEPLTALFELIGELGKALLQASGPVGEILGPELLAEDFPAAAPEQKRGSK
jgi:hypothetical protein